MPDTPHTLSSVCAVRRLSACRVLLRAGFNVPIDEQGMVRDDFRIRRMLPTIEYLRRAGALTTIIAHIGRTPDASLRPVHAYLREYMPVLFAETIEEAHELAADARGGDVILLENIRRDPREKENDPEYACELAALGDIYVNDAFSASHRDHASIVGVPRYLEGYAGIQMLDEIAHMRRACSPRSPSLAILGGAKFDTKLPLVEHLLDAYDTIIVAGALANDIYVKRGLSVGKSLTSGGDGVAERLARHERIIVPSDVVVEDGAGESRITKAENIRADETVVDAGPESLAHILSLARESRCVLWNGPLGAYERGYDEYTKRLAEGLTETDAELITGGGDTAAVLASCALKRPFDFISTGGGAMLAFLKDGTLPGIEALKQNQ